VPVRGSEKFENGGRDQKDYEKDGGEPGLGELGRL